VGVLAIVILSGCALQKPLWGDLETGLNLAYRGLESETRQYQNTVTVIQDLAMIGQKTEIKTDMGFALAAKPREAEDLALGVTIDEFRVGTAGTQGSSSPDTSGIPGKSFDMVLSQLGREVDVEGAAELTYDVNPFTKSNLKPLFQSIFPDLPSLPVRVGDTWTSTSDTTTEDSSSEIHTAVAHVHTLVGFEAVDGLECAKISSEMTGTMNGKGNQMGSEFTLNGKLEGTSTWHFAYREAVLVDHALSFTANLSLETAMGPLPMTLVNTVRLRLVR